VLNSSPVIHSLVRKMGVGNSVASIRQGEVLRTDFEHTLLVNGQPTGFYGLIQCSRFTSDGDSGAPVVDDSGRLVGIVLGGRDTNTSDAYTAVMPAAGMFARYGLRLAAQQDIG